MQEEWWEGPVTFICQYGWIILIIIVLAVTAYFARDYWLPALQDLMGVLPAPRFFHAV